MTAPDYHIVPYGPEHLDGVLDVMGYLWGVRGERGNAYFRWKYEENPARVDPPGMVALKGDRVVGFRGYFPNRWMLGSMESVILSPCDTCVAPDHRRRGISVMMGQAAMDQYADSHGFFLNMSSSESSLPGYLRMGFHPLVPRTSSSCYTPKGYLRLAMRGLGLRGLGERLSRCSPLRHQSPVKFANSLEVLSTKEPMPEEMERIAGEARGGQIRLIKDRAFYDWRFRNPRRYYAFHYVLEDGKPIAFITTRQAPGNQGDILDYGGRSREIDSLVRYLLASGAYRSISIWDFALRENIAPTIRSLKFRRTVLPRFLGLNGRSEEIPLLLRPVKREPRELDWSLDGVDLREMSRWSISGICSEAY